MSTSPNLAILHATEAQSQKVTTLNSAVDKLDLALTDNVALSMTDADFAITAAQIRENIVFTMVDSPDITAARNVTIPDGIKRFFMFTDNTDGQFALTVKTVSGTGFTIPVDEKGNVFVLYSDGTDVTELFRGSPKQIFYSGYVVGGGTNQFSASQTCMRTPVPVDITFPADFSGAFAVLATATTGATTFDVRSADADGMNEASIGSIIFAATANQATFTTTGNNPQSLTAGDILIIRAPGSADATADELGWTLIADKDN